MKYHFQQFLMEEAVHKMQKSQGGHSIALIWPTNPNREQAKQLTELPQKPQILIFSPK